MNGGLMLDDHFANFDVPSLCLTRAANQEILGYQIFENDHYTKVDKAGDTVFLERSLIA